MDFRHRSNTTNVTVMSTSQLDPNLVPIAESLIARSNGAFDPQFVRTLVADVASEFDGAPVRNYIEVLVAKEAADELRRLRALRILTS